MSLLHLPNELVLRISWFLLKCPTCDCNHVSRHLSALALCNRRLHAMWTPELLRTASALHILLWAISHSRPDTATLAINYGAELNIPVPQIQFIENHTSRVHLDSPVEIACRMRIQSPDATSHQLKLDTLAVLLRAGGKPVVKTLRIAASRGDMDLLELCLPYIADISERYELGENTLLEVAGARGHVQTVRMLLAAGARVNSNGVLLTAGYFPPLWAIREAPLPVLQILLDAGADATWEHAGTSIVKMLLWTPHRWPDLAGNVDLLARYGSRVPRGDEAIALWRAPVWELWTTAGSVGEVEGRAVQGVRILVHEEYRGWMPTISGASNTGEQPWLDPWCKCPVCPVETITWSEEWISECDRR